MKRKLATRVLALALTGVLGVSMLAGCGGGGQDDAASTSGETSEAEGEAAEAEGEEGGTNLRVTVQAWMMGKYDFEGAKASFEENHPGVTVTYNQVDNVDVTTSMLEWSQGKTSCDIAIGGDRSQTVSYAANDYIVEFTEENFFNGDFTKDKFYETFLENGNIEGQQFMIPLLGEVVGIVCNVPMMEEAGLVDENGEVIPAETWDELYEYAAKLTKDGQTGLGIDWGSNMMMYTYEACLNGIAGTIYKEDGKTLEYTGDDVKSLLEVWKKLIDDGYTTTDVFADMDANRTQFKSGQLAMHLAPASRWIEAGEVMDPEDVAVIPVPGTDVNGSLNYIHGMVIPKVSENQELAIQFIKEELLKDSFQQGAINAYGKMSPLKAHYENLDNKYWPTVLEFTENAITAPLYKDMTKLDTYTQTEMQQYLTGAESVEDFQTHMDEYLSQLDLSTGMN
ncbi:MAG TPA: extracellular solute-binding protein [Candidatus Blautia gallistercoris]|uniref:Extracellular solute-binding protein n=1 Tax=Candidatus Blautia gallistercoris TaxID=2838490 RepID=A0A9D2B3M5_9FIRM|nr:extracellular solute-binding protein [Candidatus Blautia gallistercoris]